MQNCNSKISPFVKIFNALLVLSCLSSMTHASDDLKIIENGIIEKQPQIRQVQWPEIYDNIHVIVKNLPQHDWKGIVAVARGGLTPSHYIAKLMKLNKVLTFCIESYKDYEQMEHSIVTYAPPLEDGGRDWLVVDDISDTGNTFRKVREHYPNAHYVALFAKPQAVDVTTQWGELVAQKEWIEFPWETLFQFK